MHENRIIIDSSKRKLYTRDGVLATSSLFEVELMYAKNHVRAVHLHRCVIPNTIYNITASNCQFSFTISGNTYVVSLTYAAYTANTITAALQTLMNGVSAGFTVSYDVGTFKCTISNATAFSINTVANNCYKELGFVAPLAAATSQVATSVVSLTRPYHFLITIGELSSHYMTVDEKKATFVIPKNVNSNGVIDYEPDRPIPIPCNNLTLKTLNIQLSDQFGNSIDLNGSEWTLIIELETRE